MVVAKFSLDLTAVLVAILGGGFVTGLVALLRFRVDKDAIVVSAAQGAVIVQTGVIDALQEELARAREDRDKYRDEIKALEKELEECGKHKRYLESKVAMRT